MAGEHGLCPRGTLTGTWPRCQPLADKARRRSEDIMSTDADQLDAMIIEGEERIAEYEAQLREPPHTWIWPAPCTFCCCCTEA